MKFKPARTAQWLFITIMMAAVAFAAGQTPPLPDGEGKTILNAACAGCHGLDLLTVRGKEEWKGTVERMVTYGAILDAKQAPILIDYLAANLGPKPAAADDAGKKILEAQCASCHGLDIVSGRTGTKGEWQEIVDRMVGRGASLTDKDIAPLVDYLTKTYPPK